MSIMKKNRLVKSLVGIMICFSLLTSGITLIPPQPAQAATASSVKKASNIINLGKRYLGVRYQFGATTGRTYSFDCSSFTQYIYKKNGINIPRTSKQQAKVGKYVSKKNLRPGDLVFFYSPIHHVGIYIGNGKVMHTYGKPGVTISSITSGWWSKHYTTARRVL